MGALAVCEPVIKAEYNRMSDIKGMILAFAEHAQHGIFFTRNIVGDPMTNIYCEDDVAIDICYDYGYFEIFGLTLKEQIELERFYCNLVESWRIFADYPKQGWGNRYDRS